jgi:hypothetical protein
VSNGTILKTKKKMYTHFKSKLRSRIGIVAIAFAIVLVHGCGANDSNAPVAAPADANAKSADEIVPPTNPEGFTGALGNVSKLSDTLLELATPDKPLFIKLTDSLHIFAPSPSSLSDVKGSAYVGVISKKQANQEQAVQVLILPEELRGLNEGSFMLPAEKGAADGGRMTNGSASDAGDGGGSRMSNGNVSGTDGTSLTLQFQGHSRTVNVPAGTPVVEYKRTDKKPNTGDKVFVLVKKGDGDMLKGYKIVCF